MPDNDIALRLIAAAGGYVAAPSANLSGRPSPTALDHVIADMAGRVEMIIGGGEAKIGLESTIIDLTAAPARILRPGHITAAEIAATVGSDVHIVPLAGAVENRSREGNDAPALAPGTKYRHYQPKGRLTIVDGAAAAVIDYINAQVASDKSGGLITGVIATDESHPQYRADYVKSLGKRGDGAAAAHNLYRVLREFDDEEVAVIYAEAFRGEGFINEAVCDRLARAAEGRIVTIY
jgi:L-threonylcarbamoyladenylate synthase